MGDVLLVFVLLLLMFGERVNMRECGAGRGVKGVVVVEGDDRERVDEDDDDMVKELEGVKEGVCC